jgi:hypothetical protein
MSLKYVSCGNCGWEHYEVSRAEAENGVRRFNEWYDTAPDSSRLGYLPYKEQRKPHKDRDYTLGRSTLDGYLRCDHCGADYTQFVDGGTAPNGCTIGPILRRTD